MLFIIFLKRISKLLFKFELYVNTFHCNYHVIYRKPYLTTINGKYLVQLMQGNFTLPLKRKAPIFTINRQQSKKQYKQTNIVKWLKHFHLANDSLKWNKVKKMKNNDLITNNCTTIIQDTHDTQKHTRENCYKFSQNIFCSLIYLLFCCLLFLFSNVVLLNIFFLSFLYFMRFQN